MKILILFAVIALLCENVHAFSMPSRSLSMSMSPKPKGCGSKPYEKKKVAVFGTGGYMGATIFGFIQRASSIYGTGLGGSASTPLSICATPAGSLALNKVLGQSFKLAFAGEDLIRLTNMENVDYITKRLKGMNAAVLGTVYTMERKSVALNTYEKTPNDKTYEFYLDHKYAVDTAVPPEDIEFHLKYFQNSIDACKAAGLEHIVVVETPNTSETKAFGKILDDANIPFTYIDINGQVETTKFYNFEEGIQNKLDIDGYTLAEKYQEKNEYSSGDWSDAIEAPTKCDDTIAREDIAALVVQSLISLDWTRSRYLSVSPSESLEKMTLKQKSKLKSDKDWCIKSEVIAKSLQGVE